MDISSGVSFLIVVSLATLLVECGKLGTSAVDGSGQLHLSTCPCSKRRHGSSKTDRPESSPPTQDLSNEFLRQRDPAGTNLQQVIDFINIEKCGCGCRQSITRPTTTENVATTVEETTMSMTDFPTTTDRTTSDREGSTIYDDYATTTEGYKYNRTCNDNSSECVVVVSYPNKSDVMLKYRCYPPSKCPSPTRVGSVNVNNEEKTNKDDQSNPSDKISGGTNRPRTEDQLIDNGSNSGFSSLGSAAHHHTGYSWIGHSIQSSVSHGTAGDHTYSLQSQSTAGDYTYSQSTSQSTTGNTLSHSSTSTTDRQKAQGSKQSYPSQTDTSTLVGSSSVTNESRPILSPEKPGNGEVKPTYVGTGGGGNGGKHTNAGSGGGGGYLTYPEPVRTTPRTTTTGPPEEEPMNLSKNILTPPDCGVYNEKLFTKIIGGSPSTVGKWPWVVAFGFQTPGDMGGQTTWICGGALVTAKSSITAAHCLDHPSMKLTKARFGDLDLDDDEDGARPVTKDVSHGIKHPLYNKHEFINDIAIVVLKRPLRFKDNIRPICLPFRNDMRNEMFNEMNPYIAGWGNLEFRAGTNSMLYEAQVPVVLNEDCAKTYTPRKREVKSSHLCAGGNGKDTCQGDSGGPLMVPWKNHFYTIGVVSWGFRCGTPGYPGVYTRITSYLDWLQENLT